MENQHLVQTIKQWLDLEDKISQMSKELRDMRKKKKELNMSLMGVMKENEIDCFDCNNGQIMYTRNNVKKSINKKYLHDILGKYFQDESSDEAIKLCSYILENRDVQVRENIKLKKKNNNNL
jgi:predicted  nucleic acid-binding Zn-ribbon protein